MSASLQIPSNMTVAEFLEWCPDDGQRWELVDGTPRAMAPAKVGHGQVQNEVGRLLGNHLAERGLPCSVVTAPGVVPRMRAAFNFRVPDLAVTCGPTGMTDAHVPEPTLIVEILSPSNQTETWANVWAYGTIPSLREILVLRTVEMRADVLRRLPDSTWPEAPEVITAGDVVLESIGYRGPLAGFYRTTALAPR